MEGAQRGARPGCSGTMDNLLIDRMVTLDCHRKKRNLSMGWVDAKKTYDSIDHGWLEEMMIIHRFPSGCAGPPSICQEAAALELWSLPEMGERLPRSSNLERVYLRATPSAPGSSRSA